MKKGWKKKTWRKQINWLFRYVRWRLCGSPEPEFCTCLDPWTCGKPHRM
jgi:hypothetical protein